MKLGEIVSYLPGFVFRCVNTPGWPVSVLTANFTVITGYETAEFLSHKLLFTDITLEADAVRAWSEVQAALEAKRPYQIEYRIRRRDGSLVYISEHGNGVWDAEGKLQYLVGYAVDVTEHLAVETELRIKNEELERLVKSLVDRELKMIELKDEVGRLRARYEKQ